MDKSDVVKLVRKAKEKYQEAQREYVKAKLDLKRAEAKKYLELREVQPGEKKPTEKEIEAHIRLALVGDYEAVARAEASYNAARIDFEAALAIARVIGGE